MTAGNPPQGLLDLPIEILEDIVQRLCAQEILRLRILSRSFRDLIDSSPAAQYRVDLFSAALEDDPGVMSQVLADRRAHLEEYRSRWDRYDQATPSSVELPPHRQRVIDGEVLACIQEAADNRIDVTFIRLPSISRGIQRKQWVVRGLPRNGSELRMLPELDVLVIPEIRDSGSFFQIHLLQLSDGRPHPLAITGPGPPVFSAGYFGGNIITELSALISERRLVVTVTVDKFLGRRDGNLFIWDWQSGHRILKTSGFRVIQAQVIDDYRILGIVKLSESSEVLLLVLWDTSGPRALQTVFETSSFKLGAVYAPERLMSSASMWSGMGLHRADPNRRVVGVVCQGSYGGVRLDDDYLIIISTADLCAHASSTRDPRIGWGEWQSSATIVRVKLEITAVACISGSRFFAVVKGVSHTAYATLLRIYDFSPGARGRRHPNRPLVRDLIVNAGCVERQPGTTSWGFSEDNLLMFHAYAATNRVTLSLWTL